MTGSLWRIRDLQRGQTPNEGAEELCVNASKCVTARAGSLTANNKLGVSSWVERLKEKFFNRNARTVNLSQSQVKDEKLPLT